MTACRIDALSEKRCIDLSCMRMLQFSRRATKRWQRLREEKNIVAMQGMDDLSRDTELVLGLVGPVGSELDKFVGKIKSALNEYEYKAKEIRLSRLAEKLTGSRPVEGESDYERRLRLMDAGDALRAKNSSALALAAIHQISVSRPREASSQQRVPLRGTVHILRSLKHPEEVRMLRRVYGPGFFLIGVVTTQGDRIRLLKTEKGCSDREVSLLLKRDEHDGDVGQRTRDTFQLSDVFLDADDVESLTRFFELVFGNPHETPQPDEHAMFLAFSAALRSADLSRQVGAVVTSSMGDVVAIGMNDVPRAGGGLCWPGESDQRDHVIGYDTNERRRTEIVDELIEALRPEGESSEEWRKKGWSAVKAKGAAVLDITEYGRAVHAEMEALLSCARTGVGTHGGTLYTTTFPCHNCAKHIIASGIRRVVYVEPYPKSQAIGFYGEMIEIVEGAAARKRGLKDLVEAPSKVRFEPFVGVGPRRFFDLFSVGLSSGQLVKRKTDGGTKRPWTPLTGAVRVPLFPNSYLIRETIASSLLSQVRPQEENHDQEEL